MAEKPVSDRTESATPKRREEAREKGNVARSQELNSAAVLLMGITAIYFTGSEIFAGLSHFMQHTYLQIRLLDGSNERLFDQFIVMFRLLRQAVLPILLLVMMGGLIANVSQVGFMLSTKALMPEFSKINPASGFKRIFSARSLVETLKGILKIGVLAWFGYSVINTHLDDFSHLSFLTVGESMAVFGQVLFELAIKIGLAIAFLAIADFMYQKYDYEKGLRMSKQEVKDEAKQYEGSAEIKGRQRSMMRSTARKRMMDAVPDATVVVTNPTHIAIALRYDGMSSESAPTVVAKGKRKIAARIIAIAKEHGVPVIQNKPLAWSLFDTTEIGGEIPVAFYQIVAEVLAQVYRMKQGNVAFA